MFPKSRSILDINLGIYILILMNLLTLNSFNSNSIP